MKRLTKALILVLVMLSATVTVGLIAGWNVWPIICVYWITLTVKNSLDCVGGMRK